MAKDPGSLRTALGRVRFLGSAKSGTHHAWHMRVTSVALVPLTILFVWIVASLAGQDYNAVRDVLYEEGLFDINVVPGMTVPTDSTAMFSLRTHNAIKAVVPEHPDPHDDHPALDQVLPELADEVRPQPGVPRHPHPLEVQ